MKNLNFTLKIVVYISLLGILFISIIAFVSINKAEKVLNTASIDNLHNINEVKRLQVEEFIKNKESSLVSLIQMPFTLNAVNKLGIGKLNSTNSAAISKFLSTQKYHNEYMKFTSIFQNYMNINKISNVILVSPDEGFVYFSAEKIPEINAKLTQQSNRLSTIWRSCINTDKVVIGDMSFDNSHTGSSSILLGKRIMKNGENMGTIIIEISTSALNKIISNYIGLGSSGESYIVGDDYFFRTDSRFSNTASSHLKQAKTKYIEKALSGQSGTEIMTNYRGNEVLTSFSPLHINGLNWVIVSEINETEIMAPKNSLLNTIVFISILMGIIMVPVLYIIGRQTSKALNMEVKFAKQIANGDLEAKIDINQTDEIGELANALREIANKTKEVIITVVNATSNLADASSQLSGASQGISSGASEQASSIEEVSASMEQMTSNIQQNADNAKQTEDITNAVSTQVESGSNIVLSSVESMGKIADKISIISDIAFQTNILALNASVEAARAGEYGKGFGVVATEVGKLADKTKTAAYEINEISKNSVEIATQTKELMGQLVPSIQNSSMLVREISAASKEQRDAAEQINNAIQMLNDISQQNAASAEEMATNSEELSSQSEQLLSVISYFKIDNIQNERRTRKSTPQRLITERKNVKTAHRQPDNESGIDIELNSNDDLDDDFERF